MNSDVRPSTLKGVKRLATQIRKERGIKHSEALELAAQAATCANYRHAQRKLRVQGNARVPHILYLTVYWYDKEKYQNGRETLEVALSKPILDICGKSDLKLVRGFGLMRMVATDHFVSDRLAPRQNFARDVICQAERSVRFMEHTDLRPSREYRAAYPDGTKDSNLPDTDHATKWVDPTNGQFILIDEPYSNVPNLADRAAWAQRHGWWLRKSSWPGMYFPHRCDLYVATDGSRSYDFNALMAKIDSIPAPLTEKNWIGESAPSFDLFVSPAAKTPQDRRRARSKGTIMRGPTAMTIPYSSTFGDSRRRPAGAMPIADHIEMGRIIKSVIRSPYTSYGVDRRMGSLRSRLEDWLGLEIGRDQLEGPEFFDVYYHAADSDDPYVEAAQSRSGLIRILGELRQKLQAHYPDCAPLREQLHRIDMSVLLIGKMKVAAD
nr:DUF5623 domain-containing protein [uncultured Rhodopila sp.]